jgi:two-component system sensor histidine kinase KdpD
LIGRLSATARVRLRQVEAERRDLAALTDLSQGFLADTSRESLLGLAADRLRRALQSEQVSIWLAQGPGDLSELAATPGAVVQRNLVDLAYRQGNSAAYPSELGGTDIYLPIPIGVTRAGVLVARGLQSTERMAEGCAVLLGLALERERFLQIAREAEKTKTSEQMKSTLLAALAHDLTTPVATARAAVENLQTRIGASDESRLARTELESLSRHVSDLMEVVRLDSGVTRPRRERVGCGQIVEAALARFGDALSKHALFVDVPSEEIAVEVDPSQLTEALGHGLENAARYSPDGSEVRVSVSKDDDKAFIRVFDQGDGSPASDRERVFERFVRLPSTAAIPGTGLGLSISRSLVEMNGGELRIGTSEQGGAVFEIVLPKSP